MGTTETSWAGTFAALPGFVPVLRGLQSFALLRETSSGFPDEAEWIWRGPVAPPVVPAPIAGVWWQQGSLSSCRSGWGCTGAAHARVVALTCQLYMSVELLLPLVQPHTRFLAGQQLQGVIALCWVAAMVFV